LRDDVYKNGCYLDVVVMSIFALNGRKIKKRGTMPVLHSARHDRMKYGDIKLYTGTSCPELATRIATHMGLPLCERQIIQFPNENLFIQLHSSVRGQDCYAIQTTSAPVHRNLMELLILMQTLRLDSAARVTAVIPYLCYARSDKKDQPRIPITARLVADMIEVAGADRYLFLDLHAGQIQGFFSIPGDVLTAFYILIDYLKAKKPTMKNPVVVTADLGFAKKAATLRFQWTFLWHSSKNAASVTIPKHRR
jgi:ribose-phosphate pyrophosphokinase